MATSYQVRSSASGLACYVKAITLCDVRSSAFCSISSAHAREHCMILCAFSFGTCKLLDRSLWMNESCEKLQWRSEQFTTFSERYDVKLFAFTIHLRSNQGAVKKDSSLIEQKEIVSATTFFAFIFVIIFFIIELTLAYLGYSYRESLSTCEASFGSYIALLTLDFLKFCSEIIFIWYLLFLHFYLYIPCTDLYKMTLLPW